MKKYVKIGKSRFSLTLPEAAQPWAALGLFETQPGETTADFTFFHEQSPLAPGEEADYDGDFCCVWQRGELETRLYRLNAGVDIRAVYREDSPGSARIAVNYGLTLGLFSEASLFNPLALERHLLRDGQFILHTSCVVYEGGAVLFTGPSGVGKSTQAALWEKYAGARVINGDRGLLEPAAGLVHGLPFSGTSGICLNESVPVRAIVCLRQGAENRARALRPMEAFQELYQQSTRNPWSREYTAVLSDLLQKTIDSVPTYLFSCTKDENAVKYIDKLIFSQENVWTR